MGRRNTKFKLGEVLLLHDLGDSNEYPVTVREVTYKQGEAFYVVEPEEPFWTNKGLRYNPNWPCINVTKDCLKRLTPLELLAMQAD